ncbi:ly6-C antigen like 1 isoform X2 [Rattus norvegicus]|uniref:Ly6-C antigen like 1 n=1 Tax=Rattus norvegicus TaxID=10116 RepID=F7EWC5_RAT|nr:lymphocyte antigen 6B-like isoform X2 [Rattus norvegicus]XP_038935705.1 lymphocyte antigen 6B-like isoform X2 [Rattus norvegicus]
MRVPRMNSSCAMKSCVLIFFLALLCAERAQGLTCYNCIAVPLNTTCSTATCPYSDGVCVSQVVEAVKDSVKGKAKSNLCLPGCPKFPQRTEILGTVVYTKISCCNTDFCNAAGPTGGSTWTMAGVLLFSLGSVLLQTLL